MHALSAKKPAAPAAGRRPADVAAILRRRGEDDLLDLAEPALPEALPARDT